MVRFRQIGSAAQLRARRPDGIARRSIVGGIPINLALPNASKWCWVSRRWGGQNRPRRGRRIRRQSDRLRAAYRGFGLISVTRLELSFLHRSDQALSSSRFTKAEQ
ncbi:hypothetical protein U1Q18_020775 [Sarracenia purpurea var. burkii]